MSRAIDVAAIMSPVLDDNTVTQAFSHPRTAASRLSQNYYEWQKDRLISNLQNSVDEKDQKSAARLRSCAGNNDGRRCSLNGLQPQLNYDLVPPFKPQLLDWPVILLSNDTSKDSRSRCKYSMLA
jgi:hypothetical protein